MVLRTDMEMQEAMAASMVAVEMLKLLLLLEDAKSSWDGEARCASFTGESFCLCIDTWSLMLPFSRSRCRRCCLWPCYVVLDLGHYRDPVRPRAFHRSHGVGYVVVRI